MMCSGGTNVANAGMGNGALPVEQQTHRLHRFDGQRLVCLDERAVRRQVMDANRIAGVKRSPERAENLKSDARPTIPRRTHHHTCALYLCKPVTTMYLSGFYGDISYFPVSGPQKGLGVADYILTRRRLDHELATV